MVYESILPVYYVGNLVFNTTKPGGALWLYVQYTHGYGLYPGTPLHLAEEQPQAVVYWPYTTNPQGALLLYNWLPT